jgi:hypothetical protein
MNTTVMKDSRVGDAWIAQVCREVPVQRVYVLDPKTGQRTPNGNILTGPVRLAFTDAILTARPQQKSDPNSALKHSCTLLFPPYADMTIFWEEYNRIAATDFAKHWNGQQYVGLDVPIFNAGMKSQYSGFTMNLNAMNTSSQFKPSVVDRNNNGIIDPSRVYPGVWAIVAVNPYASGKNFARKGPRFGLQAIQLIADDTNLAGSPPDPKTLFAGVNITPPVTAPAAGFGAAPPQIPGQGGQQAGIAQFYPPGGGQPPQAAPAPLNVPGWGAPVDPMKQFGF